MIESFQDYVEQKESEEEIKLSAGNLIVFRNKSIEGKVMDELELHRYCCRRMFLGNVHLITYI